MNLSQSQSSIPANQSNTSLSSTRWHSAAEGFSKPGHTIARMLFCIWCCNQGPAKKSPAGFLPTIQAESKCAGVVFLLYHLRPYVQRLVLAPVLREYCSISYTVSHWALYSQEEPCLLNKQLFNILFSPHCSVCGLKPSLALNTEPVVSLQAF